MAEDEFEIEITSSGKVTLRTVGIKGARCLDRAELFARIIGREVSRLMTAEFFEEAAQMQQIAVREHRD